mgnify:FL=1
MKPLLEVLKENGEMPRQEAIDAVVDKVGLSEEQLSVLNEGNGKSKARGRVGWASSYLRVAGALDGPRRGYFALGKNAERLLHLNRHLTQADLKQIPEYLEHQKRKAERRLLINEDIENDDLNDDTPQDLIDRGIKRLRSQLIDDLLEQVKTISPSSFESLILQVLAQMGYGGGDAKRIQGVPRGPDG